MTNRMSLWMRHEQRTSEKRTPLIPEDAARLIAAGIAVTVEESPQRAFDIADYEAAGCSIVPPDSWIDAPSSTYVLGLKELPTEPDTLHHRHIYFGHAYKQQGGATALLRRFTSGGGELLDLEYLIDDSGRRLAAFGYWAGYVGAALSVLYLDGRLPEPINPWSQEQLDAELHDTSGHYHTVVVGALGRCGRGAGDALAMAGLPMTSWDIAETQECDRSLLRTHDLLVNTVHTTQPTPPLLTELDLNHSERQLRLLCDVTCDVGSRYNLVPIYDDTTSWQQPVRRLRTGEPTFDVLSIDNLPALLPAEASTAFSASLTPYLLKIDDLVWQRARKRFHEAIKDIDDD